MANDVKPDLILITESWCSSETTDAFLTIPDYSMQLRKDREDTAQGRGGGLLVFSRTGIDVLPSDNNDDQHQCCKFVVEDVTFYLVYRSPSAPADSITKLADMVRTAEEKSVIIGDFNMPDIDWRGGTAKGRAKEFLEATEDSIMTQLVNFSTHIKGNVLDLVLTNIPERIPEVYEGGRLGRSDHSAIVCKIQIQQGQRRNIMSQPDWSKADWASMRKDIGRTDWRKELSGKSADEAWNMFSSRIQKTVEDFVPKRRRRNHNRPAWMSQEIMREVRRKKKLWAKAKIGEQKEEYEKLEKKVKNMIRSAKRRFERKLAEGGRKEGNKRKFNAYVRQKTKSRPTVGPLRDKNGATVKEDQAMANVLNSFFSEVFTREDKNNIPEAEEMDCGEGVSMVSITKRKVQDKIKKLRTEAAAGPDKIGPKLLKELSDVVASPLATIMRRSIESGQVPGDWKEANVTPIFKKGQKSSPGNYRPVSLTSVSCKMMEAIVKDDIVHYLDKKKLIRTSQHGFVKGRSCVSNILEFLDKVTVAVDGGEAADVIFLDFAKAFDKVPPERLLKKLRGHGIKGKLLRWIREWLTGRRQRVVLNGKYSTWEDVLSGVPQGSVLGPLLFLIFINDLDLAVAKTSILNKFADDTKLAQVMKSEEDRNTLQRSLDSLVEWSECWGMQFNVAKCKVMHVGRSNHQYEYTMGGNALTKTTEERDLGIIMTDKLKPSAQCAKAARVATAVLGQVSRAFQYRDKNVFIQLYKQQVRPHLEFSCQAWSPWQQGDKDVLEKVQKRAISMVSGLRAKDYEGRLQELGLTTLEERRHQADMHLMYKILHGKDDQSLFRLAAEGPQLTRNAAGPLNVRANHGRLEVRSNFFSVRVTEKWNMIPSEIKTMKSVTTFKDAYKRYRRPTVPV